MQVRGNAIQSIISPQANAIRNQIYGENAIQFVFPNEALKSQLNDRLKWVFGVLRSQKMSDEDAADHFLIESPTVEKVNVLTLNLIDKNNLLRIPNARFRGLPVAIQRWKPVKALTPNDRRNHLMANNYWVEFSFAPVHIQGEILKLIEQIAPIRGFINDLPHFLAKRDDFLLIAVDWPSAEPFPLRGEWHCHSEGRKFVIPLSHPQDPWCHVCKARGHLYTDDVCPTNYRKLPKNLVSQHPAEPDKWLPEDPNLKGWVFRTMDGGSTGHWQWEGGQTPQNTPEGVALPTQQFHNPGGARGPPPRPREVGLKHPPAKVYQKKDRAEPSRRPHNSPQPATAAPKPTTATANDRRPPDTQDGTGGDRARRGGTPQTHGRLQFRQKQGKQKMPALPQTEEGGPTDAPQPATTSQIEVGEIVESDDETPLLRRKSGYSRDTKPRSPTPHNHDGTDCNNSGKGVATSENHDGTDCNNGGKEDITGDCLIHPVTNDVDPLLQQSKVVTFQDKHETDGPPAGPSPLLLVDFGQKAVPGSRQFPPSTRPLPLLPNPHDIAAVHDLGHKSEDVNTTDNGFQNKMEGGSFPAEPGDRSLVVRDHHLPPPDPGPPPPLMPDGFGAPPPDTLTPANAARDALKDKNEGKRLPTRPRALAESEHGPQQLRLCLPPPANAPNIVSVGKMSDDSPQQQQLRLPPPADAPHSDSAGEQLP
ncbi:hypothetical protein CBR_g50188 [Chara braunii]|uniref:Uncharacterized protein n=1 Tax=Chara braunii TaxID=69332 RepID=A0A388M6G2_CHABU|nr:hypothetical protein CBR_g50188 [Chara braunii]|eukprot:GBG90095.1 hypothetical protein CBR_g50188 [Chara braunii]